MERSVEIDACFSNVVDAAIDITVACKGSKKKSAHSEVLMDTSQTFDEGTLKVTADIFFFARLRAQ